MKVTELHTLVQGQQSEIEKLTRIVSGLLKAVDAHTTLIAQLQGHAAPAPACDCEKVTCEECLSRAMGQRTAPAPAKRQAGTLASTDTRPAATADFVSVVIPYLAQSVRENITAKTDCRTEKLVGYPNATVTDYRFYLTPDQRKLYTAARKGQNVNWSDALTALAGACERIGVKK